MLLVIEFSLCFGHGNTEVKVVDRGFSMINYFQFLFVGFLLFPFVSGRLKLLFNFIFKEVIINSMFLVSSEVDASLDLAS